MKHRKLNSHGFSHLVIVGTALLVVAVAGTFSLVARANHTSLQSTANSGHTGFPIQNKLSNTATSQASATPTQPASSPPSATASKSTASGTPTATPKSSASTAPGSSAPASSSEIQSPLAVLTSLISSLDNGGLANVTASNVDVPGPISTAQARPLVFTANGQTYFAYTQEQAPLFSTSAADTANSMAMVTATASNPALVQAHLDKSNNLVDPNLSLVGYSTGGN